MQHDDERHFLLHRAILEHPSPERLLPPLSHSAAAQQYRLAQINAVNGYTPEAHSTPYKHVVKVDYSNNSSARSSSGSRIMTRSAVMPFQPGEYEEMYLKQRDGSEHQQQHQQCNLVFNFESRRRQEQARKEANHKLGLWRNEQLIRQVEEDIAKRGLPVLESGVSRNSPTQQNPSSSSSSPSGGRVHTRLRNMKGSPPPLQSMSSPLTSPKSNSNNNNNNKAPLATKSSLFAAANEKCKKKKNK